MGIQDPSLSETVPLSPDSYADEAIGIIRLLNNDVMQAAQKYAQLSTQHDQAGRHKLELQVSTHGRAFRERRPNEWQTFIIEYQKAMAQYKTA